MNQSLTKEEQELADLKEKNAARMLEIKQKIIFAQIAIFQILEKLAFETKTTPMTISISNLDKFGKTTYRREEAAAISSVEIDVYDPVLNEIQVLESAVSSARWKRQREDAERERLAKAAEVFDDTILLAFSSLSDNQ